MSFSKFFPLLLIAAASATVPFPYEATEQHLVCKYLEKVFYCCSYHPRHSLHSYIVWAEATLTAREVETACQDCDQANFGKGTLWLLGKAGESQKIEGGMMGSDKDRTLAELARLNRYKSSLMFNCWTAANATRFLLDDQLFEERIAANLVFLKDDIGTVRLAPMNVFATYSAPWRAYELIKTGLGVFYCNRVIPNAELDLLTTMLNKPQQVGVPSSLQEMQQTPLVLANVPVIAFSLASWDWYIRRTGAPTTSLSPKLINLSPSPALLDRLDPYPGPLGTRSLPKDGTLFFGGVSVAGVSAFLLSKGRRPRPPAGAPHQRERKRTRPSKG